MVESGAPDELNLVPTSQLLHRQARAEVSFLHSITTLFRSDPQYVRSSIASTAQTRSELIPDEKGAAPKVEDLLNSSDYLATEVRYMIHNALLVLGKWVLVEKLLKELVEHEEKVGYMAAQVQRDVLMDQARDLVEQTVDDFARRLSRILIRHPKFQQLWVRDFTYHEKWTGARIAPLTEHPYAVQLRQSQTLDGALYRFSFYQEGNLAALADLFSFFTQAPSEDTQGFGDYLVENINQLRAFYNFYRLLGPRGKHQPLKIDPRLRDFKSNSEKAQKILNSAPIERHIKNIDSLGQETKLQKIWKEFDIVSQKKAKVSLEELIGYEKLPARWYIPPHRPRIRAAAAAPPRVFSLRPQREPDSRQPPVAHDPVKLTPVSYLSDVVPKPIEETPPRIGPKIKTTGIPNPPPSSSAEMEHDGEGKEVEGEAEERKGQSQKSLFELPFYVKKSAYELFERLFNPAIKGPVGQEDFIWAMCSLGWEYENSLPGSRARLNPPHGNQPFLMHMYVLNSLSLSLPLLEMMVLCP
ncbi:hypothetical protein BYT27DRAFT_7192100 [Phlegmacium glaucopus]|nr:hypothetical protein BYT27DRAFT_7192100 [Phlegmacium glaucopus]